MHKEGITPGSDEISNQIEAQPVLDCTIEIGFRFTADDKEQKLAGIAKAQTLIVRHQGIILDKQETFIHSKGDIITQVVLKAQVTQAVAILHHDFDSVLNNAETGCGAGWVDFVE